MLETQNKTHLFSVQHDTELTTKRHEQRGKVGSLAHPQSIITLSLPVLYETLKASILDSFNHSSVLHSGDFPLELASERAASTPNTPCSYSQTDMTARRLEIHSFIQSLNYNQLQLV